MNLLLDTHVLLWWLDDDPALPRAALDAIRSTNNRVLISAASAWEIAIKRARGKLQGAEDLSEVFEARAVDALDITIRHAVAAGALPPHHQDPFDRMLIAQAQVEECTLVSVDSAFEPYDVDVLNLGASR
jgi:PIN domain nuclease of toxin-antitoxin system